MVDISFKIRKSFSYIVMVMTSLLFSCTSSLSIGHAIISQSYSIEKKQIAIAYELQNHDASQLMYLSYLTQAFMKQGYNVIERFRIKDVISELQLDQSGLVNESAPMNGDEVAASPSNLKRIGRLYGISQIAYFGRWHKGAAYLRIIDCESAEIMAVITIEDAALSNFDITTAELLVLALKYAAEEKDYQNKPVPISISIRSFAVPSYRKKYYGIKKVLLDKEIGSNHAWIYVPIEE